MFFADAVKALASQEKIRRRGWMPGAIIFASVDDVIRKEIIGQPAYGREPWTPKLEDLTASDWEIHVPRPGEPA